jgi:hypothetical protein
VYVTKNIVGIQFFGRALYRRGGYPVCLYRKAPACFLCRYHTAVSTKPFRSTKQKLESKYIPEKVWYADFKSQYDSALRSASYNKGS